MSEINFSVIIPAYNEEMRIINSLESLKRYFNGKKSDLYEIIVVDDGSQDNTVNVVKEFSKDWPQVRVIENRVNKGKGYSVNSGIQQSRGRYILFMDADNSVDISHADVFIEELENGYDVVIGSIQIQNAQINEHSGWHRRALGHFAKLLIGFFSVPGIKDTQRGFKLFSRDAVNIIFPKQTIERWGFDIEILMIAWINGLKIKEMPVVWNNPSGSKVTLWSYLQTLRELGHIVLNRILGKYTAHRTKHYSQKT